jgi:DNA-binding CsgD family transcriptional regulator
MADLADWMAENGGTVSQAAKALGISRDNAKHIWQRIRKRLGAQAI